jgi:hypothetical protein
VLGFLSQINGSSEVTLHVRCDGVGARGDAKPPPPRGGSFLCQSNGCKRVTAALWLGGLPLSRPVFFIRPHGRKKQKKKTRTKEKKTEDRDNLRVFTFSGAANDAVAAGEMHPVGGGVKLPPLDFFFLLFS